MKNVNKFKIYIYQIFLKINPRLFYKIQHFRIHKKFGKHTYWPNISNPKTFNEKTIHSKCINQHKKLSPLVDKESAKEIISSVIGEQYIVPTQLVIKDKLEKKNLDQLSPPFIMKPTHLSGEIIIINNEEDFDLDQVNQWIDKCLTTNLDATTGEVQYRNLKPKIIIEDCLGSNLLDYKLFCFHGEVHYIQVDHDRHTFHSRSFYKPNWSKQNFSTLYPMKIETISPPNNLAELISIAERLSKPFDFVRVDLYDTNGKVYFGELTFHHGSGYEPFTTYKDDLNFGNLWQSFYSYKDLKVEKIYSN
ncbi:ATP-grasp fold amidoligase family protein [Psychroflexus aestuariivivens]|uniref:ATP-grasp fold amidoligase family protein n=1 Tax=Psychroflexus aestuariivivens TaxID=1795040 RepID=UPI000FD90106|nr:ATP-grasp fold amidoligase family protein [Psychroflexus aestuariivivens]